MEAKQMIYSAGRKNELLDAGTCCNYNYYILNLGTHPTAYVEIPFSHSWYGKDYDEINIVVHGGLTYSNDRLFISETNELKGWFIGWDYDHYDDYAGYEEMIPKEFRNGGKKWTTEEIQKDVYAVCKQIEELGWIK